MTAPTRTKDQQAIGQALLAVMSATDDPAFQVDLYKQLTAQAGKISLDSMLSLEISFNADVKSPEVRDAFIEFINQVGGKNAENAEMILKSINSALNSACSKKGKDLDETDKSYYGRLLQTAGALFVKFPQHLDTEYARIHVGEHHMPRHIIVQDDLNEYMKLYRRATLARIKLVGSELTATPTPADAATPATAPSALKR